MDSSELAPKLAAIVPALMQRTAIEVRKVIPVGRGWVRRVRSTEDRRVVHLEPTAEGRRAGLEMHAQVLRSLTHLLSSLDPAELDRLARGLEALAKTMEADSGVATMLLSIGDYAATEGEDA
jgi:hypothetical protein